MTPQPSKFWTATLEEYEQNGSLTAERIKNVLSSADFSWLCAEAVRIRQDPRIRCSIDRNKFALGYYNIAFELSFSDSVYWIARVSMDNDENPAKTESTLSEVATMRYVRAKTTIPVPEVYAANVSSSFSQNQFGFPYLFLEAMPGRVLDGPLTRSVPEGYKSSVAAQYANYLFQLSQLQFDSIGRLMDPETESLAPAAGCPDVFRSSLAYFTFRRSLSNAKILDAHPEHESEDWDISRWILSQTPAAIVQPETICGPFPLWHPDLHFRNLLFDTDYKITAVIDWSGAQTVPQERFAVNAEFILPPAMPEKSKQSIREFRDLVVAELKRLKAGACVDIVGSPRADLVWYADTQPHRIAVHMARFALGFMFGRAANWEMAKEIYKGRAGSLYE